MLRRVQVAVPDNQVAYDDGYLTVDSRRRLVTVAGQPIHLTPTEFKLLVMLIENTGRVITPRELLENVWGHEYADDLYYPRVYVSQLRHKIEPDAAKPTYIQTEHRVGYRFERRPAPNAN